MEREWNRGSGICRQFLPIRHPSCCSRLIPMVVISEDTGNNSYNNLKSIPIWKIYISRTFPQALSVSCRTFDSNNLCYWLSNFRVNPPLTRSRRAFKKFTAFSTGSRVMVCCETLHTLVVAKIGNIEVITFVLECSVTCPLWVHIDM
jgi:hypothetical protein